MVTAVPVWQKTAVGFDHLFVKVDDGVIGGT